MRPVSISLSIAVWLWLVVSAMPVVAWDEVEDIRLLQSAFIYNFGKFTRWPEKALGESEQPLFLCTAGLDELIDALQQIGGKTIKGRTVALLPLKTAQDPSRCHMLYVSTSEQGHIADIIASVHGKPVLTISELDKFAHSGGIIQLFRDKDRVRFIINQAAASGAGLRFSSRLLNLAVIVGGEEQ